MHYTIIIPIHNEEKSIPNLLSELKAYSKENQILIINDGSDDSSKKILNNCDFISLINMKKNYGKGYCIRRGIENAKSKKIIIFDGDLELETRDLSKLMILDKSNNINFVIGSRFINQDFLCSIWDFGNLIFKIIFNIIYKSSIDDVLCCAKAFYKNDLEKSDIKSVGFDIDIEILTILIQIYRSPKIVPLNYKRRNYKEGKKITFIDSARIFYRMIIKKFK